MGDAVTWSKVNKSLPHGIVGHVVGYKSAGKVRVRFPDKGVSVLLEADLRGGGGGGGGAPAAVSQAHLSLETRTVLRAVAAVSHRALRLAARRASSRAASAIRVLESGAARSLTHEMSGHRRSRRSTTLQLQAGPQALRRLAWSR